MRLASGDARDHILSHKKRPRTIVSALRGFAAVETSKNLLSRNFWSRSIFDFCNSIRQKATLPLTRLTRVAAAAVLGGNALPIQKIDLVEGPTRLIEEQHQPQPIGQIGFAGEIYSWIGHGRDAHATYEAKA